MKKYLFLIVLVFFITINILGNYVISVRVDVLDQNIVSKTKDNSERYTSKNLLNTEEIDINNSLILDEIVNSGENLNVLESDEVLLAYNQNPIVKENEESKYNLLILADESVKEENVLEADNQVERIPRDIIISFIKDGWRLEVTDEDISEKYFGGALRKCNWTNYH